MPKYNVLITEHESICIQIDAPSEEAAETLAEQGYENGAITIDPKNCNGPKFSAELIEE